MTSFYQDLYTFLTSREAVTNLVGERIHPKKLPEDAEVPAITATRITTGKDYSHQGDSGLNSHVYQLKCWAETHKAACALADVLEDVLSGYRGWFGTRTLGGSFMLNRIDDEDPDTGLQAQVLDFKFNEG